MRSMRGKVTGSGNDSECVCSCKCCPGAGVGVGEAVLFVVGGGLPIFLVVVGGRGPAASLLLVFGGSLVVTTGGTGRGGGLGGGLLGLVSRRSRPIPAGGVYHHGKCTEVGTEQPEKDVAATGCRKLMVGEVKAQNF